MALRLLGHRIRRLSSHAAGGLREEYLAEEKHALGTTYTWKYISLFGAIPAILYCGYNAYKHEKEHQEHYHQPEFVKYSHLRIRSHPWPWGDGNHSLFHGKNNALPTGYEEAGHSPSDNHH